MDMEAVEQDKIKFTLQSAFNFVIHDLDYYKGQDKRGKDRIRNYRRFLKAGTITKDQMEKVIRDYGFSCIQESTWKLDD